MSLFRRLRLFAFFALPGARASALAWLCALALVLSQTLAALHGVAHHRLLQGAGADRADAQAQVQSPSQTQSPTPGGLSLWLGAFLPDHDNANDCKAFDQLNHADQATGAMPVVVLLALLPVQMVSPTGLATARWHAQFDARGPPTLR